VLVSGGTGSVAEAVRVGVGVWLGGSEVLVAVNVGVEVLDGLGGTVPVGVTVAEGVTVGEAVGDAVGGSVPVDVAVGVALGVQVRVGVGVTGWTVPRSGAKATATRSKQ
jgi:hypothetical protein